ncbi:hypothetical protein BJY01DRAFT_261400 [Aspergillus pseudoustus]|uniref:DUF7702 domain-containing protein n=1 Tax=Aspergillus pseudoustus TaxID=1810923 RepID=A0ABR4IN02_9EURO
MPLTPRQSLSLTLLILYTPALIPTTILLYRHSLGRAWGWLYLFVFTVLRIVGAALQFASGFSNSYSPKNGLRTAAGVLASIGVMTLLLGMLEGVEIVKPSLPSTRIPPRVWTLLHLSQYAAFILSIVYSSTGRDDLGCASAVIVACLFLAQVGIVLLFFSSLRREPSTPTSKSPASPRPLSRAKTTLLIRTLLLSIPFLAVRVAYMLLSTFTHGSIFTGKDLDNNNNNDAQTQTWTTAQLEEYTLPNVYIVAFMQYAMEIVVFALFVGGGFVVPASRGRKLWGKKKSEGESDETGSRAGLV